MLHESIAIELGKKGRWLLYPVSGLIKMTME